MSWRWPDACWKDHTDTLRILLRPHSFPHNVSGKTFFPSLWHIQCRLLILLLQVCFSTYKKTKMTKVLRLIFCRPSDRSQHKGLPQQQIMQHIIQEGRIYHTKRKLRLTKARRWEQLQWCSKAKPTRGSIPVAMRVATTSVDGLDGMHENTVTQCLHEKSSRKEIDVMCPTCQRALKYFGLTKKNYQELSVTFKIGVERNKVGKIMFSWKKNPANLNIDCGKTHKTVYDLQEKRGVELEKEEDGEHSAQTELTQSMCPRSELLLTAIVFSQAIIGQETF